MDITIIKNNYKLIVSIAKQKRKLMQFFICGILIAISVVGFILGVSISEISVISVLLGIMCLPLIQVTEFHFNREDKSLIIMYSVFGKVIRKKKTLNNYEMFELSIQNMSISPIDQTYNVYTLRATGIYYYYDLFHFTFYDDALFVGKSISDNLEINLKQ